MDLGIAGKVALITGASKGLGFGIARALVDEGASVAISSRSAERIEAAAATLGVRGYEHDAADADGAPEFLRRVEAEMGPIDILVVNSGGPPASPDSLSFTLDQWRAAYDLLLLGAIALVQAAVPGMQERNWGRVVSVSSSVVREPNPFLVLSSSHRAGLLAALKMIATQVAPGGVTVNSLLPGVIATDRAKQLGADSPEFAAQQPMRRVGTIEEFAAAAAFLCSQPAAYITGEAVRIDGGATRSV